MRANSMGQRNKRKSASDQEKFVTGTSIVLPVGYMDQRSSPHIPLEEVMWQAGEEVIQITSSGGYLDNLLGRLCEF